ncbi:hypothetical protein [Streptomyces sp. NPDC102409]|uniref:hypothetical protein n=1 Tax=Streptomyces sp. NPDC102409 TaxID=3366172 RepID=UPI0037FFED01
MVAEPVTPVRRSPERRGPARFDQPGLVGEDDQLGAVAGARLVMARLMWVLAVNGLTTMWTAISASVGRPPVPRGPEMSCGAGIRVVSVRRPR